MDACLQAKQAHLESQPVLPQIWNNSPQLARGVLHSVVQMRLIMILSTVAAAVDRCDRSTES